MVRVLTSVHGLLLIHVWINIILVFYLFLLQNSLSLSLSLSNKKGSGLHALFLDKSTPNEIKKINK